MPADKHKEKMMTIKRARQTIAKAFKADPDFRHGYVANVACVIMDRIPGYKRDPAKRNEIADEIIRVIFES